MKQRIRNNRFFSVIFLVALVVSISSFSVSPAFAFVDASTFLYPIWQAYGAANGVNIALSGDEAFAHDSFNDLYDGWQEFEVNQGNQNQVQSLSDFVSQYRSDVKVEGTGTGALWKTNLQLDGAIIQALAKFWKYLITEVLGGSSVSDAGFSHSSGNFGSIISSQFSYQPFPTNSYTQVTSSNVFYVKPLYSDVYFFTYHNSTYPSRKTIVGASLNHYNQNAYLLAQSSSGSAQVSYKLSTKADGLSINYYNSGNFGTTSYIPDFDTLYEGLEALNAYLGGDVESMTLTATAADGVDVLGFPDVDSPDYVATPDTITWNVPYDQTADLDQYLDIANTQAIENDLVVQDTAIAPPGTEIYTPLIPVNLPSFNFSLNGIWHYVVDWINSLQDFFQLVLYIWSQLPYAMVVPVYASVVILIVVGLYRRFFM